MMDPSIPKNEGFFDSIDHGLMMSIDLEQDIVGFVAKKSPEPLLLDKPGAHDPAEFFDPIPRPSNGRLLKGLWKHNSRLAVDKLANKLNSMKFSGLILSLVAQG